MNIDAALLSRIQFAFTISFHILFPAFSIGLAIFLTIMEACWLKTKNIVYLSICKFWTTVFALTFGMGVVSGIVMEFQFGTNWSGFTQAVGGVLGALFTYEVMTAFFVEAGFLGVMLFGWNRVGPKLHFLATILVTMGTTISAYWIMSANSWMQHPIGYHQSGGIFTVANWNEIIFNPLTIPRFIHMLFASYISAAFVICSVSALYLLQKKHINFAKKCFSFSWMALLIMVPLQIVMGDVVGEKIHSYQPIKTAAIEGIWNTTAGAPFLIFAIPSQEQQKNYFEVKIPNAASFINTHDWHGNMVGLNSVAPQDRPTVAIVFFSFRVMLYIGFLMLFLSGISLYLRIKKRLYDTNWFLKFSVVTAPLGFIALWCGWITAEIGRQPWIVYNIIRTVNAASHVAVHDVVISLILIAIVYGVIFGYFYFYFLHKILHKGPMISPDTLGQPFQYMSANANHNQEFKL